MLLEIKFKISDERAKKEITLRKLASLSSIPKSTLQRIEKGTIVPKLDQLIAISIVLKVDIKDLYEIRIVEE